MKLDGMNELKRALDNCKELYDIAWEYNQSDHTRNALSQKTITYMPEVLQVMAYILNANDVY